MTDEEYEAAKTVQKNILKSYINDTDPTRALKAVQMMLSALITGAGSLENLTAINAALLAALGPEGP